MKYFTIILFLTTLQLHVLGQSFNGKLFDKADSTVLSFASIKLTETGKYTTTNEKGDFYFLIPQKINKLHLEISYVGCKTSIVVKMTTTNKMNNIYVECLPTSLKEVMVEGLTSKEIVKKAVASIGKNYFDSSYASPSFYRQYQKVNGKFRNLIEAQAVVMFNLSISKNEINAKEAFAVDQMRRSNYYKTEYFDQDNFSDFMNQNPIYHLMSGLLNPNALAFYSFSFDTSASLDNYIINYKCSNFTSENHGIDNYSTADIDGEGWESGKLTINKESFAFIKIERNALRDKGYNYPKYNNFVLPDKKFTQEFVEGHLLAEYELIKDKWYLKTLIHTYTNEFFRTQTYQKAYVITECFEWFSDTVTRYIDNDLIDNFYFNPNLSIVEYAYDESLWDFTIPPFYYFNKETIYKDLEKNIQIEQQFEMNGK